MCGIAGIVGDNRTAVRQETLEKMRSVLQHRGPDSHGIYIRRDTKDRPSLCIGLAHCRLSILDLSTAGRQPMMSGDGRLVIVHNGEIYNHEELRAELEGKGHVFRSRTDTEVILTSYLEWGFSCLDRFNGMFAFALWDEEKERLFCARDRLGIKPFYYYYDGKKLVFSSEIKAIQLCLETSVRPNQQIVRDYLLGGLVDHTDETFFQGIDKLSAGKYLVLDKQGLHFYRYWDFDVSSSLGIDGTNEQHGDEFRELLKDSVALRLRSDVPVGSCLSGGIDSTSIVCLINSLISPEQKKSVGDYQKTFSAVFRSPALNERNYIMKVISHTKAKPHWIEPTAEGFMEEVDQLLWHQEEPFASSSVYAQWCVFRKTRQSGIRVVLDGQGADEQLCGYRKFSYFFLRELVRRRHYWRVIRESLMFLKNFEYFKDVDLRHSVRYFSPLRKWSGMSSVAREESDGGVEQIFSMGSLGSLAQRIKLDLTHYSLPALLRYEDKNSMAFSVESRVPFLDFRLVEYLASLPMGLKIRNGWTKYILRQAMKGIIPEKIRLRKDKLAFDTPQDSWIRNEWRDAFIRVFSSDGWLTVFLKRKRLLEEFDAYLRRKSWLSGNFFFRAFVLQKWAERFSIFSL